MASHDIAPELSEIHAQLPDGLTFPIESASDLKAKLPNGKYTFRDKPVNRAKAIDGIPADVFPIVSLKDFDKKISRLIRDRDAAKPSPKQ